MALLMALGYFHMAWAYGWLDRFGLGDGFARTADMRGMSSDVQDIKIELLEQRLYDTQRLYCVAIETQNVDAERFYDEQVRKLHRQYFVLTRIMLDLPDCKQLGSNRR